MAVGTGADWRNRIRVWDLPTRVFHWSLVALVSAALLTGYIGGSAMVWHGRAGIAICGLLTFRLVWGFSGSTYARFTQFLRGPSAIREYLQGRWQGVGHNPLGALSVVAMLIVLLAQVATGLAGNDDIAFNGPLYPLVSKNFSNSLTELHELNTWLIWLLLVLHVAAVGLYARVKKENLVLPMLRGWRERRHANEDSLSGGGFVAFVIALAIAVSAAWVASGNWILAPPPPPPGQTAPDF